ncbi:hypothetical protein PENTCL1PPCAC_7724, partial [Pristionchus entomophagus]
PTRSIHSSFFTRMWGISPSGPVNRQVPSPEQVNDENPSKWTSFDATAPFLAQTAETASVLDGVVHLRFLQRT